MPSAVNLFGQHALAELYSCARCLLELGEFERIMIRRGAAHVLPVIWVLALGCRAGPPRPANVPASATWVDNVFIECVLESQSKADRCTVYDDKRGEILADGLFALNTSFNAAAASDLQYAAYGDKTIYLADARKLFLIVPSEHDPSNRLVDEWLRRRIGGAGGVNCRRTAKPEDPGALSDCAIAAFARRESFFVRFYQHGIDSHCWQGFAGDGEGNVWELDYDSLEWKLAAAPEEVELLDHNRIIVMPCPKPTVLKKMENDKLTCARPQRSLR